MLVVVKMTMCPALICPSRYTDRPCIRSNNAFRCLTSNAIQAIVILSPSENCVADTTMGYQIKRIVKQTNAGKMDAIAKLNGLCRCFLCIALGWKLWRYLWWSRRETIVLYKL
jgi:hypothetical protein